MNDQILFWGPLDPMVDRGLKGVVENKSASSFVVFLGKAISGQPTFMSKTGGPDISEMAIPKQVQTSCPKNSGAIRFVVNGR